MFSDTPPMPRQIGERGRRAPGSQSLAECRRGLDRRQILHIKQGLLEPDGVDDLGRDHQPVAATPVLQLGRCRSTGTGESLPQAGDVADQCPFGTRRRIVTPGGIEQAVDRSHGAGPDQKRAENQARNRRGTGPPTGTGPSGPSTSSGPRTRSITHSLYGRLAVAVPEVGDAAANYLGMWLFGTVGG